jgi:hypothetical protein
MAGPNKIPTVIAIENVTARLRVIFSMAFPLERRTFARVSSLALVRTGGTLSPVP